MYVEKAFDFLVKTQEPYESIAVFEKNIKLFYNIHGEADFFFENDSKKEILVFPARDLSILRFNPSKVTSNLTSQINF